MSVSIASCQGWTQGAERSHVLEPEAVGRAPGEARAADRTADPAVHASISICAAARVCTSLFYGLVLQSATDPTVDVDRYVDVVLVTLNAVFGRTAQPTGRKN